MKTYDLRSVDPRLLVNDATHEEVAQSAIALPAWDARSLYAVDIVLMYWIDRVLQSKNNIGGIRALSRLIERLLNMYFGTDWARFSPNYYHRWNGYLAVLGARSIRLNRRNPTWMLEQSYAMDVIKNIEMSGGEIDQGLLLDKLGLSQSQLTRLLGMMEEHGLVERRLDDGEEMVSPGETAPG